MFGLGFGEMVILGIVLLVVVGPRELPKLLKTVGSGIKKLRGLSTDLREQSGIDDIIADEGLRDDLDAIRSLSRGRVVDSLVREASRPVRKAAGRKRLTATADLKFPEGSSAPQRVDEYPQLGPDSYDCLPDDAKQATIEAARAELAEKKAAEADHAEAQPQPQLEPEAQPTPAYAKAAETAPASRAEPDSKPAAKPAATPKRALPSVPPKAAPPRPKAPAGTTAKPKAPLPKPAAKPVHGPPAPPKTPGPPKLDLATPEPPELEPVAPTNADDEPEAAAESTP